MRFKTQNLQKPHVLVERPKTMIQIWMMRKAELFPAILESSQACWQPGYGLKENKVAQLDNYALFTETSSGLTTYSF